MKKRTTEALLFATVLMGISGGVTSAVAQVITKETAGLALAEKLVAACEKQAAGQGLALSLAVVDEAARPVLLKRMDGASYKTLEVAWGKAVTSALMGAPSGMVQDMVEKGRSSYLTVTELVPIRGGMPILYNGRVIGGFAVSGSPEESDEQCVKHALQNWQQEVVGEAK